jgi:hypothetical protein
MDMDEDRMRSADDEASSVVLSPADSEGQLAGSNGQLEVSRPKRGSMDLFRAYHVLVDGADVGEVRRGQSRLLYIAPGKHEVHLEIDWARSPSVDIDVAPGETVRLVCWPKLPAWQSKKALAKPDEWIVLEHSADVDG